MELDPRVFFFTEHYRNYPAVLVRLADVPRVLLGDVVTEAWRHVSEAAGSATVQTWRAEEARCTLAPSCARFVTRAEFL